MFVYQAFECACIKMTILNYATHESCTSTTILPMISFHIEQSIACTLYIMTNIRYSVLAQQCPQILQRHIPVKGTKHESLVLVIAKITKKEAVRRNATHVFTLAEVRAKNTYRLTESCKVLKKKELSFYINHHHLVKTQNQWRISLFHNGSIVFNRITGEHHRRTASH